jgi:hypothetical protein
VGHFTNYFLIGAMTMPSSTTAPSRNTTLPNEASLRKEVPVSSGFLDYFPDAVAAVAKLSWIGNDQHNPGQPLHWDRAKSGDEGDALMRHYLRRGEFDCEGVPETVKVAWRAMALLQKEIEANPEMYRDYFNDHSSDRAESPTPPTLPRLPSGGMLRHTLLPGQILQVSDSGDLEPYVRDS